MILKADDYVLALDISTHMGVAEGRPDEAPALSVEHFSEKDDDYSYERAMGRALRWAGTRLAPGSGKPLPAYCVIEGSQTGGFGGSTTFKTTRMLMGLLGVMTGAMRAKNIPIYAPAVSTIRACFLGNGRVDKAVVKARVVRMCRLIEWHPPDHNAADAAAAWFWFVTNNYGGAGALAIKHRLALKDLVVDPGPAKRGTGPLRR